MSSSAAVLQLHHRDAFERNVTRALVAGAGAGALHLVGHKAAGAVAYFQKPADNEQLLKQIQKALGDAKPSSAPAAG